MSIDFDLSRYFIPSQLYIHGEWVDSKGGHTQPFKSVVNGQVVSKGLQWANAEDVDIAVESAAKGLQAWQALSKAERSDKILNLANLVREHADELGWLESILTGKSTQFAKFETDFVVQSFKYYGSMVDKIHGEVCSWEDNSLEYTLRQPFGICAAILPFNGPLICASMKLAPALASGNVLVLKTSDSNPFAPLRLAALATEAGIPPGVVNCVTGNVESGVALSSHMKIRKISFTGSIATGKQVQIAAAKSNLKSVTLELGGKSPIIVLPDANLDKAAEGCTQFLTLNGQGCILATRAYIHESIIDEMLPRIKAIVQAYTDNMRSNPLLDTTWSMPLFHERQRDIVRSYIENGKQDATLYYGGNPDDPQDVYVGPTIFVNASPTAKIVREEIFGPVLVVNSFKDINEVIEVANDSEYGLGACVWTRDLGSALHLANKLEAGSVGINAIANKISVPFSGWKQSGQGVENSLEGLKDWTQIKTVVANIV